MMFTSRSKRKTLLSVEGRRAVEMRRVADLDLFERLPGRGTIVGIRRGRLWTKLTVLYPNGKRKTHRCLASKRVPAYLRRIVLP